MIRRLTLLFLYFIVASVAMSQPRFVPDNAILKVGEVAFQQPKTFVLPFSNKGDKPLQITGVHASCGCMTVSYPQQPIAAGAKGEIHLTFDAKLLGSFYKEIEVQTNSSAEPSYMAIQGYVVTELSDYSTDFPIDLGNVRLSKNSVEFDGVHKGDRPSAELRVMNMERTAFHPQLMHLPSYLQATCQPEMIPPGKSGTIKLTLDSDQLPIMGLNQTSIYLARYLGDKVSEVNEIEVSAVLLPNFSQLSAEQLANAPELYVTEPEVNLGEMGKKQKLSHEVILLNMGKSPLQIKQLQVFSKALTVSLSSRTLKPGKSAKLKITALREYLQSEKSRPRVLLISDDPAHPQAIIDVIVNP